MPELELSISQTKDILKVIMKTNTATMLWGAPGIGKSSLINQIGEELGVPVYDIRLAQHDPIDLKGIPTVSGDNTKWLTPNFLPEKGEGILFLDELTCAPPAVQNAALQLILDRKLNDYKVPDGVKIIAAGNTAEHGAYVSRLSAPMKNRMAHIYMYCNWEDVKAYFVEHGIRQEIISFLDWRPELLNKLDGIKDDEGAAPTPRTWEKYSEIIYAAVGDREAKGKEVQNLGFCIVGAGAAMEFTTFLDVFVNIKPMEVLQKGIMPDLGPSDIALKYAATGAVSHAFINKIKNPTKEIVTNLINFLETLEPEFQVKTMKNMHWLKHKKHYKACLDFAPEQFHGLNQKLTKMLG